MPDEPISLEIGLTMYIHLKVNDNVVTESGGGFSIFSSFKLTNSMVPIMFFVRTGPIDVNKRFVCGHYEGLKLRRRSWFCFTFRST